MKLKSVALATLIALVLQSVVSAVMNWDYVMIAPANYLVGLVHNFALIFFFFMLYKHSDDQ